MGISNYSEVNKNIALVNNNVSISKFPDFRPVTDKLLLQ